MTAPDADQHHHLRVTADALADADHARPGPVALTLRFDSPIPARTPRDKPARVLAGPARIVHIGTPAEAPPASHTLHRPGCVLIPGLANAHTHLDLTPLGCRPFDHAAGFVGWVDMVRTQRPADPDAIREAVRRGVELSLAGGVVAVGDILGAPAGLPALVGLDALAESPLAGVGFVEFFGIGTKADAAIERLEPLTAALAAALADRPAPRLRPGLQPHAPNTVSLDVYAHAARLARQRGLPLATHLAETAEERRFIANADGPQRDLLDRLGLWHDRELDHLGRGLHPVAHLAPVLAEHHFLVAHVNDADDAAIATLARTGTSVAYCPRASAYFGAPGRSGPHRYRDMLAAGVNVCLATDSIINLDTPERISPLDDARLLFRRDSADPRTLLAMITTRPAVALGLDPAEFRLAEGCPLAGLVAVPVSGAVSADGSDPAEAVLAGTSDPELLFA